MFESRDSKDKRASTPSEAEQVCTVLCAYIRICSVQFGTWQRSLWLKHCTSAIYSATCNARHHY